MDKRFDHNKVEKKLYKKWKDSGFFNPDEMIDAGLVDPDAETFSMVLPPPNVTGTLHMGHAEMLVFEDIMTRYHRMKGDKTLWIPGTDHAAIATQAKVERNIYDDTGKTRHDLGREKFLEKVREFAEQSHDTIVDQIERMGASLDWSREAFTLDDKRHEAVNTAFEEMYDAGLIYRGNRIVNWCPRCGSTLSDDEVEREERTTSLYTFKYDEDFPVSISTTRPETKLGDTGVAVHPEDGRYEKYIGKEYKAEFAGKTIKVKVVADDEVDPEFGSGALGVTPAHSAIDWGIAERHDLDKIQIIGEDGKMTKEVGGSFEGKTVRSARKKVVEWLEENNLIEGEEEVPQNLSICYRCDTPVEPLPKLQWFVDVEKPFELKGDGIAGLEEGEETTLREVMRKVVENGQIDIIPERFEKVYFHWVDKLRDWCISRQIWYGHRVPVWYKDDAQKQKDIKESKDVHIGPEAPSGDGWEQDPDTLDTWFSSGLWTFSTLGWPEETDDLKTYHPTDVLETGYDILFFWVARMVLMTTFLLGEVPFETVYLHGLVRDEDGVKMSKSLGNVIDPVDMIEEFGADATRLSLLIGTGPGNDINISKDKVEGYHKFTTKIWNASRFINMNKPDDYDKERAKENTIDSDQEIFEKVESKKREVAKHIEDFEFNLASEKAYEYFWETFANEILEELKDRVYSDDEREEEAAYYVLETALLESLKILHPFMPYVTEEVYQRLDLGEEDFLMVERW